MNDRINLALPAVYKQLGKEKLHKALRQMHLIRQFEEGAEQAYMRGLVHGTMHLSIGQEASAVGVGIMLEPGDYITSTHRGHGHCIAKGADPKFMFAEFFGKDNGYCRGRGGSMHIADVASGNLGANGIVGGGLPIAVGAALALKQTKKPNVVICFFGDGANNEGAFHESLNMAAIWKLPVVFVCENNKYGMSNSTEKAFALENLADRGLGYGIPGVTVDGNDVVAVYEAAERAVESARNGGGPTLLECVTYRWKGHSRSDKNLYRTKEEIEEWKSKEPIAKFMSLLHEKNLLTQEEMDAVQQQATDEIIAAVNESVKAKAADPAGLEAAVFKAVI